MPNNKVSLIHANMRFASSHTPPTLARLAQPSQLVHPPPHGDGAAHPG